MGGGCQCWWGWEVQGWACDEVRWAGVGRDKQGTCNKRNRSLYDLGAGCRKVNQSSSNVLLGSGCRWPQLLGKQQPTLCLCAASVVAHSVGG